MDVLSEKVSLVINYVMLSLPKSASPNSGWAYFPHPPLPLDAILTLCTERQWEEKSDTLKAVGAQFQQGFC